MNQYGAQSQVSATLNIAGYDLSALSASTSSCQTLGRRKYFPTQKYVSASAITVYIGSFKRQERCQNIPMVARVSLVDYRGRVLLDTYVHPTHPIEDYRTPETGLNYLHLYSAPLFVGIQQRVAALIRNKILVGHRIWDFLSVLGLSHPALNTRDLALFRPLRRMLGSPSVVELATLVHLFMGRNLGLDYENSLESSRAAIDLFRSCEESFEGAVAAGAWPCDLPPSAYAQYFS
ncbi:hypothetical protein B0H34DRAFT_54432 [Crassisporium funariophilum]|nr:hypothetical protein B0H34DRAFT_54432 [Crassisporium funariophilum]